MPLHVLITGGAGFIGSHVADELLAQGCRVRALDCLVPQVHGQGQRPAYLSREVELWRGDVRESDLLARALEGIDAVVHLAAAVGVGQSMYQVRAYTEANQVSTAALLEALIRQPVGRLVVASSMSIYGEGLYHDQTGRVHARACRDPRRIKAGQWEICSDDGQPLDPVPTPESKPAMLASNYALSKYAQEQMALIVAPAYGIPTVALRLFNVYGPRQALSNPYTGVLAIFASRLLNHRPPTIFEDGRQRRDFVSVHDVARAFALALTSPNAAGQVFNVGSGESWTIHEIANRLAEVMGKSRIQPTISREYRVGDVRHCFADITQARQQLGYQPRVTLQQGMDELVSWLAGQSARDLTEQARAELAMRGLTA